MYEASTYFAFGGNNCHMQIGCHKAHAVGSCSERPAWEMDVCIVRVDIRYQPAKAVKGQALADLVADRISTDIVALFIHAWAMFLTDRLVMMGAVWEFCWYRLEGRLTLFPSG